MMWSNHASVSGFNIFLLRRQRSPVLITNTHTHTHLRLLRFPGIYADSSKHTWSMFPIYHCMWDVYGAVDLSLSPPSWESPKQKSCNREKDLQRPHNWIQVETNKTRFYSSSFESVLYPKMTNRPKPNQRSLWNTLSLCGWHQGTDNKQN